MPMIFLSKSAAVKTEDIAGVIAVARETLIHGVTTLHKGRVEKYVEVLAVVRGLESRRNHITIVNLYGENTWERAEKEIKRVVDLIKGEKHG